MRQPYPSRYRRPHTRPRVVLQPRDHELLQALAALGLATSDHLGALIFPGRSRRVVQARLRRLFAAGLLDRLAAPVVVRSNETAPLLATRPVYALGRVGITALRDLGGQTPQPMAVPRLAPLQLGHDLVASTVMVTIALAVRSCPWFHLQMVEHEGLLRAAFSRRAPTLRAYGRGVVADGAVTIVTNTTTSSAQTILIEIVHANVRGGNRTLVEKLARMAALNRQGFFRAAFDHQRLRGVLMVARSTRHAASLAHAASILTEGRQLFWFAAREAFTLESAPDLLHQPILRPSSGPPISLATLLGGAPPPVAPPL